MKYRYFIPVSLLALAACRTSEAPIELHPAIERSSDALAVAQEDYDGDIIPFFEEFCFSCHGRKKQEAGIDLEAAVHISHLGENESTWERVLAMLDSGQMPPEDERQPTDFDREDVGGFVEQELDTAIRAMRPEPGRVTARRLNRQEYNNTIEVLLGVDSEPADVFPVDDSGYGFDNIGDVLTLSPYLLEKYLAAAEEVVQEVVARELDPPAEKEIDENGDSGEAEVEEAPAERHIFVCGHDRGKHRMGCANTILRTFASKAYRRPVSRDEVKELKKLVTMVRDDGDTFEDGIELAIEAILVSPKFLFRIEHDVDPLVPNTVQYVNDFELASRLSYFLWSSMPDDELFELARRKKLRRPDVLTAQITRMIADEKAEELVFNFAGQWLELRNLALVTRATAQFPNFYRELRRAMQKETNLFFEAVLRENMSILNFLDSDFTYVNEPLAKHYGIEGIEGKEFQRITVDREQRGGVLTQASILTLTSYPTRTSPVLRGAWLMENILGIEPSPPPEGVPPLEDNPKKLEGTIREQFEQHRADPTCASCHSRIDPLGFGFENYDAIGKWRTEEREHPVDASGVMPTGESFTGSYELRQILINDPDNFVRCFTEKMLTYALGRGLEPYDRPVVAAIEEQIVEEDYRIQSVIREIVMSVPFQMRRGEGVNKV